MCASLSRGILIVSERSRTETCIQLGEFILVEGENADQPFVAQLLDLYEDGKRNKSLSPISEILKCFNDIYFMGICLTYNPLSLA